MQRFITAALSTLWLALSNVHGEAATNANRGQLFQFNFEQKKPLVYALEFKTKVMIDSRSGQRSSLTSNSTDRHYKFRLSMSGTTKPDGTTAVYYQPFDFEQDYRAAGPAGQIDTSVRGLQIVSKQNGIVIVDSENNVGMSQLSVLKQAAYGHLLSGYFDFDPAGQIKKFEGDLPFVDVWQNNLKFGMSLFSIVFPTNSIAVHDSWTNYITLKSGNGVEFNGDAVIQPWVFTRDPDETTTNGSIACFTLEELDTFKDKTGFLDQPGQKTSIVVPEHSERMDATFRFDQKSGRLISMKKADRLHDTLSMVVQGTTAEMSQENSLDVSITLISP
jgi:hypothetical protein